MNRHIGYIEASEELARLLDKMADAEEIVITRRGKPVARLLPMPPFPRRSARNHTQPARTARANHPRRPRLARIARHGPQVMFVLDSSVTFTWLFWDEKKPATDKLLEMLQETGAIVPASLWHLEVANVLIQAERRKRITASRTSEFIEILQQLPIRTEDTRIWICFHDLAPLPASMA